MTICTDMSWIAGYAAHRDSGHFDGSGDHSSIFADIVVHQGEAPVRLIGVEHHLVPDRRRSELR